MIPYVRQAKIIEILANKELIKIEVQLIHDAVLTSGHSKVTL